METAPRPATHVRWLVFALTGATSWLLYLHRYSWGVVTPAFESAHPGITKAEIGFITTAFMVTYAFGQVPLGLIGDRIGPRLVLSALIILWSLTLAAIGFVDSYDGTVLLWALFGLTQAGAYPLIGKITRSWFPLGYRTTIQGFITSLGRVGGACAPILVATLLLGQLGFPWQQALVIVALPGVSLGVAMLAFLRNTPQEHPWTNDGERLLLAEDSAGGSALTRTPRLDPSLATWTSFGMMLIYAFLSTFADMLYVTWIPTFLREAKQLSEADMGLFAPLPLVGGAVGGVIGGMLNDALIRRLANRRWARSLVAIAGKGLAAVFIALSVGADDGRLVMVLLLACKFCGDWSLPTQWGAVTDMAGPRSATVFGIVNMVGSVGGMLAPWLMGRIVDNYGWDEMFLFVAGVYAAAALAWLAIDCRRGLFRT